MNYSMLTKALVIFLTICFSIQMNAQDEKKEILIVGTMHMVPKFLKKSYKPLYKKSLKYNPDAIYVERLRSQDTFELSMLYDEFCYVADSLANVFPSDENRFEKLLNTDLNAMTKEDFKFMMKTFVVQKDYANYKYYRYLLNYGLKGSKKPLRNENDDISHRLAIATNMTMIYSMDDQKYRPEYHKAWKECASQGKTNGDSKIIKKKARKITLGSILPALFGRYGVWTNNKKTVERFHELNSFRYSKSDCESCDDGMKYWDLRNRNMAINIGEQIEANSDRKNLVVVGAGHVIGIKEELEKLYPEFTIKVLDEKLNKKSIQTSEPALASQN